MGYLQFEPRIPLSLWCTIALAAAVALVVYAIGSRQRLQPARRVWIVSLMTLTAALPLGLLLNPTWIQRLPPPTGKPRLTVLVDRSASMAVDDAADNVTRFAYACRVAADVDRKLSSQYDIQVRSFAQTSVPIDVAELAHQSPDGSGTNVAAAIDDALAEDLPQGQAMLLLSDGGQNIGGEAALRKAVNKAKLVACPIYAQTIGGPAQVHDLSVELGLADELAFVGQRVPIAVKLVQRGPFARRVNVSLRSDDIVLQQRSVELDSSQAVAEVVHPITFEISRDKPGLYRYQVDVDSLPEEVTAVNNRATLLVRVVNEPVQVLLLEGKPYWDAKFLIRTLAEDRSVELTSIVQIAPGRAMKRHISRPREDGKEPAPAEATGDAKEKKDSADTAAEGATDATASREERWEVLSDAGNFLSNPENLRHVQLLVLGHDAEVFLNDAGLEQLRKWLVAGSGSLVCFRGAPESQLNQRLEKLLPLRWTATGETHFHVSLDPAGQAAHWLPEAATADAMANLPSLAANSKAQVRSSQIGVLATADATSTPVVAYQEFGLGRVVVVEGAGMWRWAFLPPKDQERDEIYGTLWRSLTRWLVSNAGLLPSQKLALRTDRVTYSTGQNIVAQLLVRDGEFTAGVPDVVLEGDSLPSSRKISPVSVDDPGRFLVPVGDLPEGRYTLRVAAEGIDPTAGTALFDVRENLRERLEIDARGDLMRWLIAQPSGGAVIEGPDVADQLTRAFEQRRSATRPAQVLRTTAWDRWWVLATVFGCWALAWSQRRRLGLV